MAASFIDDALIFSFGNVDSTSLIFIKSRHSSLKTIGIFFSQKKLAIPDLQTSSILNRRLLAI